MARGGAPYGAGIVVEAGYHLVCEIVVTLGRLAPAPFEVMAESWTQGPLAMVEPKSNFQLFDELVVTVCVLPSASVTVTAAEVAPLGTFVSMPHGALRLMLALSTQIARSGV